MSWAGPLLVLPGVGLLIMSTSARYIRLHDELHHVAEHGERDGVSRLLQRARWFRNALVSAYLSVVLLAMAGLVLGASEAIEWVGMTVDLIGTVLAVLGVASLLISAGFLAFEATVSYTVLEDDARRLMPNDDGKG